MTQYYQWNIADIGTGYTAEDVTQLQTLIDEELTHVAAEALDRCEITVVSDAEYDSNRGIQFNHDEAIKQAIETAYERFIALAGRYDGNTENTATRDNIADALRDFGWTVADYGHPSDHYAVHVREDDGDSETPSIFVLSLTTEGMPAFKSLEFETLDALSSYVAEHFGEAIWREDGE